MGLCPALQFRYRKIKPSKPLRILPDQARDSCQQQCIYPLVVATLINWCGSIANLSDKFQVNYNVFYFN